MAGLRQRIEGGALRLILALPDGALYALSGGARRIGDRQLDARLQMALLLDRIKPRIESLPPRQARRALAELGALFSPPPPDLPRIERFSIPGPAGRIEIRLYSTTYDSNQPALLFFHGGGYVLGDLDSYESNLRLIAALSRVAVLSVEYRLAPEHPFPAAQQDALAAWRFVQNSCDLLGLDRRRLALGGDSAGAALALCCAAAAVKRGAPASRALALLYPFLDPGGVYESRRTFGRGYALSADLIAYFNKHAFADAADATNWQAAPLRMTDRQLRALPPTLIQVAGFDPLFDEAILFAERLRQNRVRVTVQRFDSLIHGYLSTTALVPAARQAVQLYAASLRELLSLD